MKKYLGILGIGLVLVSCEPSVSNNLYLKINILAGTVPLQYNTDYTVGTYSVQFTKVKFYLSQPTLNISGQADMHMSDKYFLGDAEMVNTWDLGDVGKVNIVGITFGFGVDSSRNTVTGSQAIPAYDYPSEHALSATNNMYWSWNPGYVWMKLEGKIDINGNSSYADPGETFSLHTGVNDAYRTVTRTTSIAMNDAAKTIQLDINILNLFMGYDLGANPNAHPMNTLSPEYPLVVALQDNADGAFGQFYE